MNGTTFKAPNGYGGDYDVTVKFTRPPGSAAPQFAMAIYSSDWANVTYPTVPPPNTTTGPGDEVVTTATFTASITDGAHVQIDFSDGEGIEHAIEVRLVRK